MAGNVHPEANRACILESRNDSAFGLAGTWNLYNDSTARNYCSYANAFISAPRENADVLHQQENALVLHVRHGIAIGVDALGYAVLPHALYSIDLKPGSCALLDVVKEVASSAIFSCKSASFSQLYENGTRITPTKYSLLQQYRDYRSNGKGS